MINSTIKMIGSSLKFFTVNYLLSCSTLIGSWMFRNSSMDIFSVGFSQTNFSLHFKYAKILRKMFFIAGSNVQFSVPH